MKPIKKPFVKSSQKPQCVSDGNMINITLVSEKEREIYRVPSYGYILP